MMASTGAVISAAGFSPTTRNFRSKPKLFTSASATTRRSLAPTTTEHEQQRPAGGNTLHSSKNGSLKKKTESVEHKIGKQKEESEELERLNLKDYFEQSKYMLRSDGGPPRWFSPLECGSRLNNSPLLLSLPAIDGIGLGLTLQYQRLGQIFDIWCLHIPIDDQTSFPELVKMVERTVRAENYRSPKRPIYLVGESFGGCLALAVAALIPDIDLVLILANPATSFNKSQLQPLIHLLEIMPANFLSASGVPYMLSLMTDSPSKMVIGALEKGLPLQQTVGEISQGVIALSSYLSVMAAVLSTESLLWKLKTLKSACAFANSRLHAVKAQTLVLSSGRDQLLPSREEGERLQNMLPNCQIRTFNNSGHALFLENSIDLVTIIMGASFYRRARNLDYASDYLPPDPSEFKKVYESTSWLEKVTSPVMLSTLENGKIVRGLAGIPSEGPVLFVGYHMMLGFELIPLIARFWIDRNIHLRGLAHPMTFKQLNGGNVPDLSSFDILRVMGAVPVSASNFCRLFSLNSHVLLYPGGMREALHRKGEEYKLFWPERSEFTRMAARFGAKIIPFGAVGEDDIAHLLLDYDDQVKIPFLKSHYERLTKDFVRLRTDSVGEVAEQKQHLPVLLPKVPGRFYYLFGAPIETEGRKQELRSKDKAHELYIEVKSEVERCLAYLKEKRENDPYRSILARLVYQARHGTESEIPTFEL